MPASQPPPDVTTSSGYVASRQIPEDEDEEDDEIDGKHSGTPSGFHSGTS